MGILTFFRICSDLLIENTGDFFCNSVSIEFRIFHFVYNGLTKVFYTS